MPAYQGGNSLVFVGSKIFSGSFTFSAMNNDIHGSLDVVPGGMLNSQEEIKKQILKGLSEKHSRSDVRDFFPVHSFIPSFSSLGHLQPNQNWGNPLNTNLTCSTNIQTPFDSYYGESKNSTHTSFTNESVKWLLEELDGNKQAPHFPISQDAITGADAVCQTPAKTYSVDICKVPSTVVYNGVTGWSVSGNLTIVGIPGLYSVDVKATSNVAGVGKIIATFQNGQTLEKTVRTGAPTVPLYSAVTGPNFIPRGSSAGYYVDAVPNTTSYVWTIIREDEPCETGTTPRFANGSTTYDVNSTSVSVNWGTCTGNYIVYCEAKNDCGTTGYRGRNVFVGKPQDNPCNTGTTMKISPNPFISGVIVLNIVGDQQPCTYDPETQQVGNNNSTINVKINNFFGQEVFNNVFPFEQTITIQNLSLPAGTYVVTATTSSGQVMKEQMIVL